MMLALGFIYAPPCGLNIHNHLRHPPAVRLLIALGIGLVLLWLAQRLFTRLEGNFAQEL